MNRVNQFGTLRSGYLTTETALGLTEFWGMRGKERECT